jgi:hypothetical protein
MRRSQGHEAYQELRLVGPGHAASAAAHLRGVPPAIAEGARQYWAAGREVREARQEVARTAAAAEIGSVTSREILIGGAIVYWCEGAKRKPHNPSERVNFTNSDPSSSGCSCAS